jgi:hypothetical protein
VRDTCADGYSSVCPDTCGLQNCLALRHGAGGVFIGSLPAATRLARAEIRGQVASTYFVFAYAGLTIPVIGVGVASQYEGDFRAVMAAIHRAGSR